MLAVVYVTDVSGEDDSVWSSVYRDSMTIQGQNPQLFVSYNKLISERNSTI